MKYTIIVCLLAGILYAFTPINKGEISKPEDTSLNSPTAGSKVNWLTLSEALELHKKEPRKIFFDVYTDWCGWCKKMDAGAFSNPVIAEYLNTKWYPVKFDAEIKETLVFKGREYKFVASGRRGYNELASELLNGRLSYPTTVYLDENLNKIQAVPGYMDPKKMDLVLKFFGENNYKKTTWEKFVESYKSPF